jgi:hypothetical protein
LSRAAIIGTSTRRRAWELRSAVSVEEVKALSMPKPKKSSKRKRHPNITKAIADIKKLQNAHKKMSLQLEKTKAALVDTPFAP